jgi:hypothetical protein
LIPSFNQLHGKSGVECVNIFFCYIIIFNKWGKQTKQYDYLEAIRTKKTQYKNNKRSHKHKRKTCMFVSTIVFSLGAIYCKMVLDKGKSKSRD